MAKSKKLARKSAPRKPAKAAQVKKKVAPIPAGYHIVTPHIVVRGAAHAIEFYKKALGAKERLRMPGPDGSIMHAELQIGDSVVMLGDENPQMGATAPSLTGGSSGGLFIYTTDVDKAYAKAIAAGAKAEMPPADMFWGDRYAKFADPFGHRWSMATHVEDVSPKEMAKRGAAEMAKQMAAHGAKP